MNPENLGPALKYKNVLFRDLIHEVRDLTWHNDLSPGKIEFFAIVKRDLYITDKDLVLIQNQYVILTQCALRRILVDVRLYAGG